MAKFSNETRAILLHVLRNLGEATDTVFAKFKLNCECRDGVGCTHENYNKDFALANVCRVKECPVVQAEGDV